MLRTSNESSRLGVGLYSLAEAARIVGSSANTLRRWASPGERLVPRHLDPAEHTITFLELMELHFIKMFRDAAVSLKTIRRASHAAAKKFGTQYPFSTKRFDKDGKTIFATLIEQQTDGVVIKDLKKGQLAFEQVVRPFFKHLEYQGGQEVAKFWPLDRSGRIVLDPARQFGKPIDAPSGIPTQTLYHAVRAGGGQPAARVAVWFGVPVAAVDAAVAFEQSMDN